MNGDEPRLQPERDRIEVEAAYACARSDELEELRWVAAEWLKQYDGCADRGGLHDMLVKVTFDAVRRARKHLASASERRTGGWRIEKTSCHCNREDDGHGWAVLYEDRMVRCLGCLRDACLETARPTSQEELEALIKIAEARIRAETIKTCAQRIERSGPADGGAHAKEILAMLAKVKP